MKRGMLRVVRDLSTNLIFTVFKVLDRRRRLLNLWDMSNFHRFHTKVDALTIPDFVTASFEERKKLNPPAVLTTRYVQRIAASHRMGMNMLCINKKDYKTFWS